MTGAGHREIYKKGRRQPFHLGLQAAGWLAWEYYLDFCRVAALNERPPTDEGRMPFREFEQMEGNIKLLYLSNPFARIAASAENTTMKSFEEVKTATRRLARIKAEKN